MAARAAVLWETYVADLNARRQWSEARGQMIDRLVRFVVAFEREAPLAVAAGPVQVGPNGGQVADLRWAAIKGLNGEILKLEKALGLTPEGGQQIRREAGKQTTAADEFLAISAGEADTPH